MNSDRLREIEEEANELLKKCERSDIKDDFATKLAKAIRDGAKHLRQEQN